MKKILSTKAFLFIVLMYAVPVCAQTNRIPEKKVVAPTNVPAIITRILTAVITNDSIVHPQGSIPYHHHIKAKITSIGSGVVQYKWEILNSKAGVKTANILTNSQTQGRLTLSGTGSDEILLVLNSDSGYTDWVVTLTVTGTNNIISKEYTYH